MDYIDCFRLYNLDYIIQIICEWGCDPKSHEHIMWPKWPTVLDLDSAIWGPMICQIFAVFSFLHTFGNKFSHETHVWMFMSMPAYFECCSMPPKCVKRRSWKKCTYLKSGHPCCDVTCLNDLSGHMVYTNMTFLGHKM